MTLRYVYGCDDLVASFVAQRIPHVAEQGFGRSRAIGVANSDLELIGGIVYHNFQPKAGWIEVSVAALPGHRCVTPATLAVMYRYPFMELGCQMVAHTFPKSSAHLERQGAALGGMLINIPRMFGREMDGTVCLLTYEDWVASKVCQRYKHHIAERKAA